jgi:hypothetical protein
MLKLFLLNILTLLLLVSCGDRNNTGNEAQGFSSDPYRVSTMNGLIDINQPIAEVGGQTYQISQQSFPVVNMALHQGFQQGIQPVNNKFKAKITGSVMNNQMNGMQQQQVLNITQAQVYR